MSGNTLRARPRLEALEHRLVPAVQVEYGFLVIDVGHSATVQENHDPKRGQILVVYANPGPPLVIPRYEASQGIKFYGGPGNDRFGYTNTTKTEDLPIQAWGGKGNDTLVGASKNDMLFGEAGDDKLTGWAGDDTMIGGAGADVLWGYDGDDFMYGGDWKRNPFSPAFTGTDGRDTMYGGNDDDYLNGGQESVLTDDLMTGGQGADIFVSDTWWRTYTLNFVPVRKEKINVDRPKDYRSRDGDSIVSEFGGPWQDEVKYPPFI